MWRLAALCLAEGEAGGEGVVGVQGEGGCAGLVGGALDLGDDAGLASSATTRPRNVVPMIES